MRTLFEDPSYKCNFFLCICLSVCFPVTFFPSFLLYVYLLYLFSSLPVCCDCLLVCQLVSLDVLRQETNQRRGCDSNV